MRVSTLSLPTPGTPQSPEQLGGYGPIALFAERASAVQPAFLLTRENAATVGAMLPLPGCRAAGAVTLWEAAR